MKIKILISIFLFAIPFFIFTSKIKAEDMKVSCEGNGPCNIESGSPLFNITSFAPGQSIIRQILAINKNSTDSCDLSLYVRKTSTDSQSDTFASKLFTAIRTESATLYGTPDGNSAINDKTFKDFLNYGGPFWLGNIPANNQSKINWIVTFDPSANNDLQSNVLSFDFDLTFVCGNPPAVSPTSTPIPNILGISTFNQASSPLTNPNPSPTGGTTPEVKGISCENNYYHWWLPLVIQIFSTLALIYIFKRKKWSLKTLGVINFVVFVISQIIHERLGCSCAMGIWCSKYLFINLAVFLFSILPLLRKTQKH